MTKQFKLLGTLSIIEAGRTSALTKNTKGCALLTYLIVTGEPQSREAVADLLWESVSTAQSLRNLRVLLTRIRPYIPELQTTRKTLTFQPNQTLSIDLITLLEALKSEDSNTLEAGLRLYTGDLLAGFHLEDAPRFNEWLLLTRERLRVQVLAAFDHICDEFAEQKQWDRGIEIARCWLAVDDLDERAYRWLMIHLTGMGQLTQALQQYDICSQRLQQELAVEPEPATVALAKHVAQLKADKEENLARRTVSELAFPQLGELAEPGPLPPNALVPYHRNDDFTGRESILLRLADLLLLQQDADGASTRAVVMMGMGGLGKTQLAVEYCYRYGRYYSGGVFWMSFAEADNVSEEVARIGSERGMGLYQEAEKLTQADRVGRVQKAWQEPIPRLLIFDNCEDERLLADWLPVTGGCQVLVTSRRGEWSPEFKMNTIAIPVLQRSDSISLLRKLSPRLNETEAGAISEEVGDLPLALQLSGGFLRRYRQISPAQYLAQLRDEGLLHHPSLQGRGLSYSPTNHELNVARTFALNATQLDLNEAVDAMAYRLLVCAACFAPGEPIPQHLLQASVIEDENDLTMVLLAEDGLVRLVALGFLERGGVETAVLHRLLAAFLLEEMVTEAQLRDAQASVETVLLQTIDAYQENEQFLIQLPFSANHLQYVAKAALSRVDERAAGLATAWGYHLFLNSDLTNAAPYLTQARIICEQVYGDEHPETAVALSRDGWIHMHSGDYAGAEKLYQRALAVQERLPEPDPLKIATCYRDLGASNWRQGHVTQARYYHERELALRESVVGSQHPLTAQSLSSLGIIMAQLGDLAQSRAYHERAWLAIANETETTIAARLLNNLASTCSLQGDNEPALQYAEKALHIREKVFGSTHRLTASSYNTIGALLVELNEYEAARPHLEKALAIREGVLGREHLLTARSLCNLGNLQRRMGMVEIARTTLEEAIRIYEAIQPTHAQLAETLNHLGDLLIQTGELTLARSLLERALAIWQQEQYRHRPDKAHTLISLGDWFRAQAMVDEAKDYYQQALAILETAVLPTHPDLQRVNQILSAM